MDETETEKAQRLRARTESIAAFMAKNFGNRVTPDMIDDLARLAARMREVRTAVYESNIANAERGTGMIAQPRGIDSFVLERSYREELGASAIFYIKPEAMKDDGGDALLKTDGLIELLTPPNLPIAVLLVMASMLTERAMETAGIKVAGSGHEVMALALNKLADLSGLTLEGATVTQVIETDPDGDDAEGV